MGDMMPGRKEPTMRIRFWERKWFVFVTLILIFYFAQPLSFTFTMDSGNSVEETVESSIDRIEQGSIGRRIALAVLGLFAALALLRSPHNQFRFRGFLECFIITFLIWCGLSAAWSPVPLMTARKILVLCLLCIGALGAAKVLSKADLISFTFFSTGLVTIAGLLSELALGTFQPTTGDYRFSGLTFPAFSAWNLSLFILSALFLLHERRRSRLFIITAVVFASALLILTKTRASVAAFLAGFLLYYALMGWSTRRKLHVACLAGFAASFLSFTMLNLGTGSSSILLAAVNLGREMESITGLTGRTDVWMDLLPYVQKSPLTGYGYDSFWSPERLAEFASDQHWAVPDAHNGYINLTLGLGLPGSMLFAAILLGQIYRSVKRFRATHDIFYVFTCCVVIVLSINTFCLATQLSPYLATFITMVVQAKLIFFHHGETARA
jgi:O-antigen ligase